MVVDVGGGLRDDYKVQFLTGNPNLRSKFANLFNQGRNAVQKEAVSAGRCIGLGQGQPREETVRVMQIARNNQIWIRKLSVGGNHRQLQEGRQ